MFKNYTFKGQTKFSGLGITFCVLGAVLWILLGLRSILLDYLNGFDQNYVYNIPFTTSLEYYGLLTGFLIFSAVLLILVISSIWDSSKEQKDMSYLVRLSILWIIGTEIALLLTFGLGFISRTVSDIIFSFLQTISAEFANMLYGILVVILGIIMILLWLNPIQKDFKNEKKISFDDELRWGGAFLVLGILGGELASFFVILGSLFLLLDVFSSFVLSKTTRL